MAHLIYKAPLVDEKSRERYIQTRKELNSAKTRGDIDPESYKTARKNLEDAVVAASQVGEEFLSSDGSIVLARSASVSSGSTGTGTNRSSSISNPTLSRTMTSGSGTASSKPIRKGTIFDRNNVGRLVFKTDAQTVESREHIKQEAKARKELKRLMIAYEASQQSVSASYFNPNNEAQRARTPLPVEDEGYSPRLAAESSKFYSTEPLQLPTSSTSSTAPRKKNFNFFKWTGSRKTSNASSYPSSDVNISPVTPSADEFINTISAIPRVDIDLGPPRLSLNPASAGASDRVRSTSVSDISHTRTESLDTQYSTAPSSLRNTATSGSSASSAILAQSRSSNDTLRSSYTFSRIQFSAAADGTDTTDTISRFSFSSGEDNDRKPKRTPRTMADLFLLGAAGSASKRNRETFAFSSSQQDPSFSNFHPHSGASAEASKRPTTSGSGSVQSLRRRHSISSEYSIPRSTGSRPSLDSRKNKTPVPPPQKTRGGNEDAFASMFCAPPKKKALKSPVVPKTAAKKITVESSKEEAHSPSVKPATTEEIHMPINQQPVHAKPLAERSVINQFPHPPRTVSLPASDVSVGQAYEYPAPQFSPPPPPTPQLDPLHDPLPAPPSSILLDAFISLLDEYSSAPKLFSFSRPKAPSVASSRSARQGRLLRKDSFVSTSDTIMEEPSPTSPTSGQYLSISSATSHSASPNVSTDDEDNYANDYDSLEEASFIHEKQKLESIVWFLSASKWLSFGRLLFSPGHHLLCMGQTDAELLGLDDMRILDLDGPALGGWSWHLAHEYPAALVYNITTSKTYFDNYGLQHMQPLNHRLVLTESLTSLQPLESSSFDVITARALPRILQQHEWIPLLKECHRVLKPDGYIELTIVDAVLNNMGTVTRTWIEENIVDPALAATDNGEGKKIDLHPSRSILQNLEAAGLVDIHKCWVWMPAGTIGDELSSVTSRVGRYFYDELFGDWCSSETEKSLGFGIKPHRELKLWNDPVIQAECVKENTAFRWLKCHARKGNFPQNLTAAYL